MIAMVREKLKEIERRENIRILHCVESGSRAWGFASPDSDYDIRFVYVRPMEDYLKLEPMRDVIEWQLDDVWDINGWDLQKLLRLLHKSNPTIFEWAASPIVYHTTAQWQRVAQTIRAYFGPKACMHHYMSMAKGNFKAIHKDDSIKYKKYFYVLRPMLAFRWIMERQEPAPMEFSTLMTLELPEDVRREIERLLELKTGLGEAAVGAPIGWLNEYIQSELERLEQILWEYPSAEPMDWAGLNACFLTVLGDRSR